MNLLLLHCQSLMSLSFANKIVFPFTKVTAHFDLTSRESVSNLAQSLPMPGLARKCVRDRGCVNREWKKQSERKKKSSSQKILWFLKVSIRDPRWIILFPLFGYVHCFAIAFDLSCFFSPVSGASLLPDRRPAL